MTQGHLTPRFPYPLPERRTVNPFPSDSQAAAAWDAGAAARWEGAVEASNPYAKRRPTVTRHTAWLAGYRARDQDIRAFDKAAPGEGTVRDGSP